MVGRMSAHTGGWSRGHHRGDVPVTVLQQAFHDADLTVSELARRLGVHHSSVGRVVRGHRAHQYRGNPRTRYDARTLSVTRTKAIRYLTAMGADPEVLR